MQLRGTAWEIRQASFMPGSENKVRHSGRNGGDELNVGHDVVHQR